MELGSAAKAVGSAMAQLLAAADQGNAAYTGKAARETSNAVKVRACIYNCGSQYLNMEYMDGVH